MAPTWDVPVLFFFRLQSSHWSVHFLETIPKPPKAKSCQGKLSPNGPPFIFLLFQGNLQNRTCLKGPPFGFALGTVRLSFENFLMSPKGPLRFFWYFATECMLINPEGSPCYIFRHYAFFWEKNFFRKFTFFSKKMFCAFWTLDMAPILDVLVLLTIQTLF